MTDPFTLLLQHAAPEIARNLVQTYRRLQDEDLTHVTEVIDRLAQDCETSFVEAGLSLLQDPDPTDHDIHDLIKAAIVNHILKIQPKSQL